MDVFQKACEAAGPARGGAFLLFAEALCVATHGASIARPPCSRCASLAEQLRESLSDAVVMSAAHAGFRYAVLCYSDLDDESAFVLATKTPDSVMVQLARDAYGAVRLELAQRVGMLRSVESLLESLRAGPRDNGGEDG
jgi:hypothetical protein